MRYVKKINALQTSTNIISQHTTAFGNTENGCFLYLQNIDNQHLCFCKTLSDSTGKEKDSESGYYYFGARYYDCDLSGLFLSVDPMSDKYPSISPYAYCAWNPVKLVDPDGEDIWIGDILYSANMSSDGDGYDDFSKKAIDALNEIYSTAEGKLMLDDLISKDINVSIYFGFETENYLSPAPDNSYYNIETNTPGTGESFDCDIYWNSTHSDGQHCVNGIDYNTTLDLADEIAHAFDAVNGWTYKRLKTINGDLIDEGVVNGYDKREFQAAYRVNVIREQMGNNNYRTKYYPNSKIADKKSFYKPCWYSLRTTDRAQRINFDIPK